MPDFPTIVKRNLDTVNEKIATAAEKSGRTVANVQLIAVTKYLSAEQTAVLPELGCLKLGESRPQVLWDKASQLTNPSIQWHMIGHLQRNKVKRTLDIAQLVHSVDSVRLLETIEQTASERSQVARILLEVNVSGESSKGGFAAADLEQAVVLANQLDHVSLEGLMCMGGLASNETELRRQFSALRQLRDRYQEVAPTLQHLSMGMSGDYEWAIEEGATMVRVGSVLFNGAL